MKLKFLLGENGRGHRLTALSGEFLGEFGCDPEFPEVEIYGSPGNPMRAKITLDLVVGDGTTIVDGSIVSSNALPQPPKSLPAPRPALPTRTRIERPAEERRANLERLRPRTYLEDYDFDEGGDFFHDEECDCD